MWWPLIPQNQNSKNVWITSTKVLWSSLSVLLIPMSMRTVALRKDVQLMVDYIVIEESVNKQPLWAEVYTK
jgi:hypothetical protein